MSPFPLPQGSRIDQTAVWTDPIRSGPLNASLPRKVHLSWRRPAHQTPPLSYDELPKLTEKPVQTLRGHNAALRVNHAALDTRPADAGYYRVVPGERFFNEQSAESSPAARGGRSWIGPPALDPRQKSASGRISPKLVVIKKKKKNLINNRIWF